jgi:predicted CXXCH cytochrome family protein
LISINSTDVTKGVKVLKRLFLICIVLLMNLGLVGNALGAGVEVTTVNGKASDGSTGVYLAWNGYTGAASYRILRSTDGLDWSTNFNAGTVVTFDDKTITNYVNYFYKVQALDGSSNVLATSSVVRAFPPNTSAHGNFTGNNDVCGSCHLTHTGKSEKLTISATTLDVCESCHDGTGSKYDVQNGRVKLSETPDWGNSPAGPFGDLGRSGLIAAPTSTHGLGTPVNNAPGSNTSASYLLGCGGCHDPHNQANYRLLRKKTGTSESMPATSVEAYAVTTPQGEYVNYFSGNVTFCSSCHSDYNQGTGSGHTEATSTQQTGFNLSQGSNGKYMHAVNVSISSYPNTDTNVLPLEGTNRNVICATCHMAHGTIVIGTSTKKDGTTSTVLKRAANASACEECHKK